MLTRITHVWWSSLLAGLVCSSAALALPAPPSGGASTPPRPAMIEVPLQIPSDGVLPLFGPCTDAPTCSALLGVTVSDGTTGAALAGHVEVVRADYTDAWAYFKPDLPFVAGTSLLVGNTVYPYSSSMMNFVSVVPPTPLSRANLRIVTQLSPSRNVLGTACCPVLNPRSRPRCLDVSVRSSVSLELNVVDADAIAAQHLFALEVRESGASMPAVVTNFLPLLNSRSAKITGRFDGSLPSYCYAVRAKPLTGGAVFDFVTGCIDNDLTALGNVERSPAEVESWLSTCEKPQDPQADAGALHEDDEDEGPASPNDASVASRDASAASRVRGVEGCQLAPQAAASRLGASLLSLATLLFYARRRRAGGSRQARFTAL